MENFVTKATLVLFNRKFLCTKIMFQLMIIFSILLYLYSSLWRNNLDLTSNNFRYYNPKLQTKVLIPVHTNVDHILPSEAQRLGKQIRILCAVLISPTRHETNGRAIKDTWGRHCNKLVFMSTTKDEFIGAVNLPGVPEGYRYLWIKTRAAFQWIWNNHPHDFDWVLKADDDTFVIVENLRFMLKEFNSDEPIFFGCELRASIDPTFFNNNTWVSGGSGYVLSREATRRFVEVGLKDPQICPPSTFPKRGEEVPEDVNMAECLYSVGAKIADSRDQEGKQRFMPLSPKLHLASEEKDPKHWYWQRVLFAQEKGINCCSKNSISFHYVPPESMYLLEFFAYNLRPYGVQGDIGDAFLQDRDSAENSSNGTRLNIQ